MTSPLETWWLSCHVDYACRHTGACCRSGWPIPVETGVVPAVDAAVRDGRVRMVDGGQVWLRESAEAPEGVAGTFRLEGDACVFHVPRDGQAAPAAPGTHHCAVHAAMGYEALPASCRHFPRVCLVDDRGVRVSLSHYCPTAATMLFQHQGPLEIVSGPPAVAGVAVPEGLDVRHGLPPRLTQSVLMDLEAATAWERVVVGTLAGGDAPPGTPAEVLARLRAYAERLVQWSPGQTSLTTLIDGLRASDATWAGRGGTIASAERGSDGGPYRLERQRRAMRVVAQACREPWTWPATPANVDALDRAFVAPEWPAAGPVVRRYLAAKAFGAWATYQADAARGLVRWLQLSHDVLRVEAARACGEANRALDGELLFIAVRQADLLLAHYADSLLVAQAL